MTDGVDRNGWMTAHDAELLRILSKGQPEEERRRDGELIARNEQDVAAEQARRTTGPDRRSSSGQDRARRGRRGQQGTSGTGG